MDPALPDASPDRNAAEASADDATPTGADARVTDDRSSSESTDAPTSDDRKIVDASDAADVVCSEPTCSGQAIWNATGTRFHFSETGGLTARDWEFDYVVATKVLDANTRGGGISMQSHGVVSDADAAQIIARISALRTVEALNPNCVADGETDIVTTYDATGTHVYHSAASTGCSADHSPSTPPPWIGNGLYDLSYFLYGVAAAAAADSGHD